MSSSNSKPPETHNETLQSIWFRARVREFAHRFAAEDMEKGARDEFRREMGFTIFGLALLVLGVSVSDTNLTEAIKGLMLFGLGLNGDLIEVTLEALSRILIIISVMVTIYAVYLTVCSNRAELLAKNSNHIFSGRIFMQISQKTRRLEGDSENHEKEKDLIIILNEQLETALSVCINPNHDQYSRAHKMVEDIKVNISEDVSKSFVPDIE